MTSLTGPGPTLLPLGDDGLPPPPPTTLLFASDASMAVSSGGREIEGTTSYFWEAFQWTLNKLPKTHAKMAPKRILEQDIFLNFYTASSKNHQKVVQKFAQVLLNYIPGPSRRPPRLLPQRSDSWRLTD